MSLRQIARRLNFRYDLMPTLWKLLDLRDKIFLTHACFLKFRFRKRHVKTAIYWIGDPTFALYVMKFVEKQYAWCRPVINVMLSSDEVKMMTICRQVQIEPTQFESLSSLVVSCMRLWWSKIIIRWISLRELEDIINEAHIKQKELHIMQLPRHGNWDRDGQRVVTWDHFYADFILMNRMPLSEATIQAILKQNCWYKISALNSYYGKRYPYDYRTGCTCPK